jgi:hypothetical protein
MLQSNFLRGQIGKRMACGERWILGVQLMKNGMRPTSVVLNYRSLNQSSDEISSPTPYRRWVLVSAFKWGRDEACMVPRQTYIISVDITGVHEHIEVRHGQAQ